MDGNDARAARGAASASADGIGHAAHIRADREKQFQAEFWSYVNPKSDLKPFDYVIVTNEFDLRAWFERAKQWLQTPRVHARLSAMFLRHDVVNDGKAEPVTFPGGLVVKKKSKTRCSSCTASRDRAQSLDEAHAPHTFAEYHSSAHPDGTPSPAYVAYRGWPRRSSPPQRALTPLPEVVLCARARSVSHFFSR